MLTLNIASKVAGLDLFRPMNILDFGAGVGAPTWTLNRLAAMNGSKVEAIEKHQQRAEFIVRNGILPASAVYVGDGIEHLRGAAKSAREYDLITAFMFGPDDEGHLSYDLIEASQQALAAAGQLLITSDWSTMEVVRKICSEGLGKRATSIKGFGTPESRFTYDTLVIPKQ